MAPNYVDRKGLAALLDLGALYGRFAFCQSTCDNHKTNNVQCFTQMVSSGSATAVLARHTARLFNWFDREEGR